MGKAVASQSVPSTTTQTGTGLDNDPDGDGGANDNDNGGGGGSAGVYVVIAAVAALMLSAGYFLGRRSKNAAEPSTATAAGGTAAPAPTAARAQVTNPAFTTDYEETEGHGDRTYAEVNDDTAGGFPAYEEANVVGVNSGGESTYTEPDPKQPDVYDTANAYEEMTSDAAGAGPAAAHDIALEADEVAATAAYAPVAEHAVYNSAWDPNATSIDL